VVWDISVLHEDKADKSTPLERTQGHVCAALAHTNAASEGF